jgi:periplasmic protein TonB
MFSSFFQPVNEVLNAEMCRYIGARRGFGDRRTGQSTREQSQEGGVYYDVFEESVLTDKKNRRPLAFVASIGAELVVVSVLVLVPLAYNDHLPIFEWRHVGVGAPVRPVELKPVVEHSAQRASSTTAFHPRFVERSLPPLRFQGEAASRPTLEAPPMQGDFNSFGDSHRPEIDLGQTVAVAPPPPPPRPEPTPTQQTREPIRVGGDVQMAKLVKRVLPRYPPLALTARISGTVHLIGIISRDGTIRNLQLVSGHPLLTRAAMEAVQQWIYQPTLLNGEAAEVIAPIDVNFTLADR